MGRLTGKVAYNIISKTMKDRKTFKNYCIPLAAALAVALALRVFVFDIFRVEGHSMEPSLTPGNILLVNTAAYGLRNPVKGGYFLLWASPQKEDILVYQEPRDGDFRIKRCAELTPEGVYVRGDNPGLSVDSRVQGCVPVECIAGKVIISF